MSDLPTLEEALLAYNNANEDGVPPGFVVSGHIEGLLESLIEAAKREGREAARARQYAALAAVFTEVVGAGCGLECAASVVNILGIPGADETPQQVIAQCLDERRLRSMTYGGKWKRLKSFSEAWALSVRAALVWETGEIRDERKTPAEESIDAARVVMRTLANHHARHQAEAELIVSKIDAFLAEIPKE